MENINKYIVKTSESGSSYSSCFEDEQISSGNYTKIKTSKRKSRLCIRHFFSDDDVTYKENVRQNKPCTNINQSATATLCVVVKKQKLFGKHEPLSRFSDELLPLKYSSYQPDKRDKLNIRSNKKYTSSAIKVSSQIVQTSITQSTTLWKNRRQNTGRPLQGSSKTNLLTNECYTEFRNASMRKASNLTTKNRNAFVPKMIPWRNNEDESHDTSLKLNAILSVDTADDKEKAEFLREWQVHKMLNQFKRDERYPQDGNSSLNESKNKSESLTYTSTTQQYENIEFDYELMTQCLQKSSSAMKKFDILQSLLLRLSSQESDERHATVQAIIDNDLFGIKNGNDTILKNLLWPINVMTPHPLQTSTAKLLNALVSYQIGREYFNQISMVNLLTWSNIEQIYESMADNLIAVMMKLSLNQFQRSEMLKNSLLQWLINHMEEVEFSASTFHLECMTDLLRMLMEVEGSIEFSFVKIPQLIIVLVRYLNIENEYVKINVCNALRVLLRNRTAVEIGNKIHLHRIIQDHIKKTSNLKLKKELEYIYKLIIQYRICKRNKLGSSSMDDQDCMENNYGQRMLKTLSENLWKNKSFCENEIKNNEEKLIEITENVDHCEDNQLDGTFESVVDTDYISRTERRRNEQCSPMPDQILPADLSSYISQVCLDTELTERNRRIKIENSEVEDSSCGCCHTSVMNERSITSILRSGTEYKGSNESLNIDENVNTDVIFHNSNWNLEQSSSLLSRHSRLSSGESKVGSTKKLKKKDINKRMAVDMEDISKNNTNNTSPQSSKPSNVKPTEISTNYSDFTAIAKDPNVRNEILENDSFIDELCEKVFDKLRDKIFCGANCNTNCNANCSKPDNSAKQN